MLANQAMQATSSAVDDAFGDMFDVKPVAAPVPVTQAEPAGEDDGFDDFGDFDTPTPAPTV